MVLFKFLAMVALIAMIEVYNGQQFDSYAPRKVPCPSRSLIRYADSLNIEESNYIKRSDPIRLGSFQEWLDSRRIPGLNSSWINSVPRFGIAFSGGGYRAMLCGAGALASLDSRIPGSNESGLGGLFQSASYISGLSGGSWMLSSIYHNGFADVISLRDHPNIWNLNATSGVGIPSRIKPWGSNICDLLSGIQICNISYHADNLDIKEFNNENQSWISDLNIMQNIPSIYDYYKYFQTLHEEVQEKSKAGFPVSVVDYWGRALSLQIFNKPRGGPGLTWSSIAESAYWNDKNVAVPLPIIVASERRYFNSRYSIFPASFEFTPFEMGSWDKQLKAFVELKFIGTRFCKGSPVSINGTSECVNGFDNSGFIVATSSAVFNDIFFLYSGVIDPGRYFLPQQWTEWVRNEENVKTREFSDNRVRDLKHYSFTSLSDTEIYNIQDREYLNAEISYGDIQFTKHNRFVQKKLKPLIQDRALYTPNPFYLFNITDDNFDIVIRSELLLVDGGEDGQNVPLQPLLIPQRKLEAVIAFDFSADFHNWPSGITIRRTFQKYLGIDYQIPFPKVPMFDVRYHLKPLFLGCTIDDYELSNGSKSDPINEPPLIIYIPNTEYNTRANTSTLQLLYNHTFMSQMMQNGYNVATRANLSEPDWDKCLACGILKRRIDRTHQTFNFCNLCFKNYCYHE